MNLFKKIFGISNEKELKRIEPILQEILGLEEEYSKLSDLDLKSKTVEFKERLKKGETLDDILPEAYATVREASLRVLGMKHYPVQIQGGIILHQGRIAELSTGEGKTIVATLPVYLNALTGEGVHVVTVNDYLAKRDSQWMGKVYKFLGLSVGLIVHDLPEKERRLAYSCDITYGTNNEIGFDYLRDNMVYKMEDKVQRGLNFAIIDEVDSILIDEARTPLIISGFGGESTDGYLKANEFVKGLKAKYIVEIDNGRKVDKMANQLLGKEIVEEYSDYDYIVEEKKKSAMLTEQGVKKAEEFYHIENLSDSDNIEINHYITRAIKAYGVFKKDRDYVLKDGKVIIVDESTGRLMEGRRYSEGIHQAIEAKENVDIQEESKTLASITFQNFFRKYDKLSGMTGTAKTEEEEFNNIYNLDIVQVPTNEKVKRQDKPDRVYLTYQGKINAIVSRIKECYKKGQPILVGTISVEKSEELSNILKKENIKHNVLNAKYHEQESKIIAQAGRLGAVTIATNMAGRGTDILLGGNPEYIALEELRKEGYSEELLIEANSYSYSEDEDILKVRKDFKERENRIKEELKEEKEKVIELGGLYVLGTERHESRRIDNQLRGRSGRQGDVGVSEFILSLQDDLMRLFGTDKLVNLSKVLNIPENVPIDMGILSNQIEKAQQRIESQYFQMREQTLRIDDVVSQQRDIIYKERNVILSNDVGIKNICLKLMKDYIINVLEANVIDKKKINNEEIENIKSLFTDYGDIFNLEHLSDLKTFEEIKSYFCNVLDDVFEKVCQTSEDSFVEFFSKRLLLFLLDTYWQDHMISLEELKKGIGLQAYANKDPIQEFEFESFDLFEEMENSIREEVLNTYIELYRNEVLNKNKEK